MKKIVNTLKNYNNTFYKWNKSKWIKVDDISIEQEIYKFLNICYYMKTISFNGEKRNVKKYIRPNPLDIKNVLDMIRIIGCVDSSVKIPSWSGVKCSDPVKTIITTDKIIDIQTNNTYDNTPELFNMSACDFKYEPQAKCPQWLNFLNQNFDDEPECITCLQEWFGYCLTADTRMQKIMLLIGPKRTGKSTIIKILQKLVGEGNYASPSSHDLVSSFGLQTLIGKNLMSLSDAKLSGRDAPIDRLLGISGEDAMDINIKYKEPITLKLTCKIIIGTNDQPCTSDSSTAISRRFIPIRFKHSWFGKEDVNLFDNLCKELPGIFNWALEGYRRLQANNKFTMPKSSEAELDELDNLASPISIFVKERCELGDEYEVQTQELYAEYKDWAQQQGYANPLTKQFFGKNLKGAYPQVTYKQNNHKRINYYKGIKIGEDNDTTDI